jgi:hypothetical protein
MAGDTFVSPDESWTCALPSTWRSTERMDGGVHYLIFSPAGVPVETSTRLIFAFPGVLAGAEAMLPETTLLAAGLGMIAQLLLQTYGLGLTPRAEPAPVKLGPREGAVAEYSTDLPGQNVALTLWGGLVKETPKYLLVASLGRGADSEEAEAVARRMLETVAPYQAPRNPELEQALVGRWSAIQAARTSSMSGSSTTVTYQFNPDRTFWRRITGSYFSSGYGGESFSRASDTFDEGIYAVYGRQVVVQLSRGGELRLRVDAQLAGGRLVRLAIDGRECSAGEL